MIYWVLKLGVVRPLSRILFRPWIEGEENIPASGAVLLASNHLSAGETFLLPAMIRRRMSFPAKSELFEGGSIGNRILGLFLRSINIRPMDRSGGRVSAAAMDTVAAVLEEGGVLGIYPEGTRSPDGRLYKGKTGVARLLLQTGAPVIPVAMINTQFVRTRFLKIPMMRRPGIRIGQPMTFEKYAGAGNDRDVLRWITDEIMNAIMELSGQTYVDAYASSVKSAAAEGRAFETRVRSRPGEGNPVPAPVPVQRERPARKPAAELDQPTEPEPTVVAEQPVEQGH